MKRAKAIATLLLVALVVIFMAQNAATVDIRFLFWSLSVPRAVLMLAMLGAGLAIGLVLSSLSTLKEPKEGPR